ncbi:MAG: GNAT family N-acetyltransferase [Bacteroidia bacterium]
MKVAFCNNESDLQKILALRYEILRQPWGQSFESSSDGNEKESYNAFIEENNKAIACGRLQINDGNIGQIRFMAVSNQLQGKGLGNLILEALEKKAKELNLDRIELHARENALKFYENKGYQIKEKSHLLWDQIQHFLMVKELH